MSLEKSVFRYAPVKLSVLASQQPFQGDRVFFLFEIYALNDKSAMIRVGWGGGLCYKYNKVAIQLRKQDSET